MHVDHRPDEQAVELPLQTLHLAPSHVQRLPTELLYHIIRLAACTHYKSAHACAYVSKTVCTWTAPDRWRTIICTTIQQFQSLWLLLQHHSAPSSTQHFLSLPSRRPGDFVENLFIDTKSSEYQSFAESFAQRFQQSQIHVGPFLQSFPYLNYLALGPNEISQMQLRGSFSPQKIMITSDDEHQLRLTLGTFARAPICTPPGRTPNTLRTPYSYGPRKRLKSLHVISVNRHSELTGAPMPVAELETMRSGSIAPFSLIRSVADNISAWPKHLPPTQEQTSNSSSPPTHPCNTHPNQIDNPYSRIPTSDSMREAFQADVGRGCTHIRYDTRRFSFRPCEITASRLAPFFEQLTTTAPAEQAASIPPPHFSHSRPRHAAPPRGARNFSISDRSVNSRHSQLTPKRAALHLAGCNEFQKLHLCWDPMPLNKDSSGESAGIATPTSSTSQAPSTTTVDTADWPMERQDICTNTSSQNNEAQAPPPHTAASRPVKPSKLAKDNTVARHDPLQSWVISSATESKQSKAFRTDMVDAFRTTLGWTRQDQRMLSDTNWYSRGADLDQRLGGQHVRFKLEQSLSSYVCSCMTSEPSEPISNLSPVVPDEKLALHLVAPAERLRLGGMYVPYTKEQRVQWFLDNLETEDA